MTDDELKGKVMEQLDLRNVPDSLEWPALLKRMREKAKSVGRTPGFEPVHDPNGNVYYRRTSPDGLRLTEEECQQGGVETTFFKRQEHGRYQAEALAFLEIDQLAREEGKGP